MVMDVPDADVVAAGWLAEADADVAGAAVADAAAVVPSCCCCCVDAAIVAPGWLQMLLVDVVS